MQNDENNIYSPPISSQHTNKEATSKKKAKVNCRRVGSLTFIKLIPIGLFIGYVFMMALIAILAQFGIEHPSLQLGKMTGNIATDALVMATILALFESILVVPFLLIGLYLYSKITTTSIYLIDMKDD